MLAGDRNSDCTARLWMDKFKLLRPHGVDDLVRMIVRPTPAFDTKMSVYEHRLASKDWARAMASAYLL